MGEKGLVAILGTLDTKGDQIKYLKELIERRGLDACVIDVGVGADGDHELGVEPGRAHRRHQRVVDETLARIIELQDAGQLRAPGRKAHVLHVKPDLAQPIEQHRLVAQPRQRLVVGVGRGLVIAGTNGTGPTTPTSTTHVSCPRPSMSSLR